MPITADGQWHDLEVKPAQVAGGEHWGGANDGTLARAASATGASRCPPDPTRRSKQPVVYLADIRAEALLPVFVQPAAFKSDFEGTEPLADKGWDRRGRRGD